MNVLSHYLQEEGDRLDKVCHESERELASLISCGYNTPQELMKLQRQLQRTTDEITKKKLKQEISITQARREVAEAKRVR